MVVTGNRKNFFWMILWDRRGRKVWATCRCLKMRKMAEEVLDGVDGSLGEGADDPIQLRAMTVMIERQGNMRRIMCR